MLTLHMIEFDQVWLTKIWGQGKTYQHIKIDLQYPGTNYTALSQNVRSFYSSLSSCWQKQTQNQQKYDRMI